MNQQRQSLSLNDGLMMTRSAFGMLLSAVIRFQHWYYNEAYFKQIRKKVKKKLF